MASIETQTLTTLGSRIEGTNFRGSRVAGTVVEISRNLNNTIMYIRIERGEYPEVNLWAEADEWTVL